MKKLQDEKKNKYYSVFSSYKKLMLDDETQLDEDAFRYIKDRIIRIENIDFDFARTFSIMNPQDKGKQLYGLEKLLNTEFHLTNYKNINRINEIDFRYLNGKDLNNEYKNMDEFIEYWYSIARDSTHPVQARFLAKFNLSFLFFRDSIGNPFMWSSKFHYDNTFYNPFHAVNRDEYIYFVAVLFGEINPEIRKCEELDILVYNPQDLHLELLSNAMDEILVKINFLFDYNFYTFLDKVKLDKILDDLNNMNKSINEFVRENTTDVSRETLNILTTFLDSRVSRDTYFKSLYFLTSKKNISDTLINKYPTASDSYLINNSFDKHTKAFLSDYCNEKDEKSKSVQLRTFNKNIKLLKTYENALEGFPLKCPYHIFKTNLNNLLDLKVLYHEFIVDKAEHVNEKAKIKSKINVGIDSILKRIITTVDSKNNFLSDEDKKIYCVNELYTDNTCFDLDQNEDSNIIYKTNLLLSEKIRRGYYREFKLLDNYESVFDYKIKLRETLTNIFRINDIDKMFYRVLSLYIELSNYFNELQESTKDYK